MKRDIAEFVAKCPNCQQVKIEHQKPGGLAQDIEIPIWKWEAINVDFVVGLPKFKRHYDSIWVIVDRMTKSAHFLPVKTSYSAEDYAKLYIREMVKLHGFHCLLYRIGVLNLPHIFGNRFKRDLVQR